MKLLGLTGGIGMGKSTAAGFLLRQGVPVLDTDDLARELVLPGQPALAEIQAAFGPTVIAQDGSLDRSRLAALVFNDAAVRQQLEAILHPRIRARWQSQAARWRQENQRVGVVVIPLLFETQAETAFDRIICLACTPASQHQRLLARGWAPGQISRRLAAQLPVAQKMHRSHFVVWSEGQPEVTQQQLVRILERV
jgi:dephospho-CoA kinase